MQTNDPDRDNGHDSNDTQSDKQWRAHRRKVIDQYDLDGGDQ
jgi:hypothetical protein